MTAQQRGRLLLLHALVVIAVLSLTAAAQTGSGGWLKAGSHPAEYDMGVDQTTAFTGNSSGYIKSNTSDPQGFGTYMQTIDATEYRGKRLRLSAYVRSENVESWAGVWMRIDRDREPVAFDNMQSRPITGTQSWTQHAIVLDVEPKATAVAFGILLRGKGAVWIDDLALEVVGEDVPVTDMLGRSKSPRNLDFENTPERR